MAATATVRMEGATASSPHEVRSDGRPDHQAAAERTDHLYRDHGRLVGGLCRALLRDRAEAEDAAQQVFLAAHRALLNGTSPREPAAWLATIARNECWARGRARMREPLPTAEIDGARSLSDPLAEAIRNADLAAIWSAIAALPRQQRDALLLREFGGLSYDELAGALAVSGSAVESLLFRARQGMRARLQTAYAGLTGASWLDSLARLAGGIGGGVAPVAAKVAAVGVGAAVATGGAVVAPRMLEHARHDSVISHPAKTTKPVKAAKPVEAARPVPIFVARAQRAPVVSTRLVSRERDRHQVSAGDDRSGPDTERGSDGGNEPSKEKLASGDDHSGRGRGGGTTGDDKGDAGKASESRQEDASERGGGDGSPSSSSSSVGQGPISDDRGPSGGQDASSDGSGGGGSGGGDSGGGDSGGGHDGSGSGSGSGGSGSGDSGSGDDRGVVTTTSNPVVTVTVPSVDTPPVVGNPPPGTDG